MRASFFLLLLTFSLLLFTSSAAPKTPPHQTHLLHRRSRRQQRPSSEQIQPTRPLPFSSLTLSCTRHVMAHTFADTMGQPPVNATYHSPHKNCTWSHVALRLHASATNGSNYDRIGAAWLDGVEILRTSTPEPSSDGRIYWNVEKDVTRYSSLLERSNLTFSVMLQNVVDDVYTGVFHLNFTFLYYNDNNSTTANATGTNLLSLFRRSRRSSANHSPTPASDCNYSLELNENPADSIVPISSSGEEGYWFTIERGTDLIHQGIEIPPNTYRAVIEIYVSYHGNDEFWYSNPPDAYIQLNNLTTKRGNGAYREVLVKIDGHVVGSVVPFPVVFAGGINPLFWEPIVSIGAFDLPTYEFELTPFLGSLLDGKEHFVELSVADAISFWLVDGNLHLWLDNGAEKVQAGNVMLSYPSIYTERESKFSQLDGKFEIEGKRKSEFSGWVNCSLGNFTTHVSSSVKFENKIKFEKNGNVKQVKQKVKVREEIRIEGSKSGIFVCNSSVERKYPLEMETKTLAGVGTDTYVMFTELENELKEEKTQNNFTSSLKNKQKAKGWMFVKDHDVLSGAATTSQSYSVEDSFGCYSRRVGAENGHVEDDRSTVLCAAASY